MKRNNFIDLLRLIFALMIVLIHMLDKGYIKALLRIAVPCFFIISGYFISGKEDEKIKKTVLYDLKLIIICNLAYFLFNSYFYIGTGKFGKYFDNNFLNFENWKLFILLNKSHFAGHLWYLSALLYCNIIYLIYKKYIKNSWKKEMAVVIILLISSTILAEIIPVFFSKYSIKYFYYRNFLFLGLPYYFIGVMLRNINIKENNKKYIFLLGVSSIFYLIESILIYVTKKGLNLEYYFSGIFVSIFLIVCSISYKNIIKENNILSRWGRNYSLYIYITHLACIRIVDKTIQKYGLSDIFLVRFLIVILMSLILSFLVNKIVIFIKTKNKKIKVFS